jgi:hypothetical protein
MGLNDIEDRWKHLVTAGGTIAERMVAILKQAALDIDELIGTDSHPAHLSIVQHLEQASGIAASAPVFNEPAPVSQEADPTPAGGPAQPSGEADQPPVTISPSSSSGSDGGSTS